MNKQDLKNAIQLIQPDAYLKTRVEAKLKEHTKPVKRYRKPVMAAVLCLVLVLSLGCVNVFSGRIVAPVPPTAITETASSISGGILVAYAEENGELTEQLLEGDGITVCQVFFQNIDGLSEEEIKNAYDNGMALTEGFTPILPLFPDECGHIDGEEWSYRDIINSGDKVLFNVKSEFLMENESYPLRLNVKPEHVKSIAVSTTGEYFTTWFNNAGALRYDDDLNFIAADSDFDSCLYDSFTISGDDYRKDYAVGQKCKLDNACDFHWEFTKDFFQMLNSHPDFNLTDVSSEVTFSVTMKDGSVSTSVVRIGFAKNGELYDLKLTPVSYDHQ